MSWQLFAVIQTVTFAVAAIAALVMRNLGLRRQNEELTALCQAAHDELAGLTTRLNALETTAPPEKMLAERLRGMTGGDAANLVRRLVLENEIEPRDDFPERLAQHLAVDEPEEQEFVERWRAVRAECQQLAMFLVADNPSAHSAITALFEVVEPLDQLYDVELDPLPTPGEAATPVPPEDSADVGEEEELDQAALDELLAGAQGAGDERAR